MLSLSKHLPGRVSWREFAALDPSHAFSRAAPTIMAGVFNSNTIWDKKHGDRNHTHMTARLESLGLRSLYHVQTGENHGEELTPTWYMYRNRTKGYHIDYFYSSDALIPNSSSPSATPTLGSPTATTCP